MDSSPAASQALDNSHRREGSLETPLALQTNQVLKHLPAGEASFIKPPLPQYFLQSSSLCHIMGEGEKGEDCVAFGLKIYMHLVYRKLLYILGKKFSTAFTHLYSVGKFIPDVSNLLRHRRIKH